MSAVRPGAPGATRVCPHCKATVLESATICPGCRHHLRFHAGSPGVPESENTEVYCALNVEGTLRHRVANETCEYCVVLEIRNQAGQSIARHITGVGVLQPGELRRLSLSVDLMPVRARAARAPQLSGSAPGPGTPSGPNPAAPSKPAVSAAPAAPGTAAPQKPPAAAASTPSGPTKPATAPAQPAPPAETSKRPSLPLQQRTRIRVFPRR